MKPGNGGKKAQPTIEQHPLVVMVERRRNLQRSRARKGKIHSKARKSPSRLSAGLRNKEAQHQPAAKRNNAVLKRSNKSFLVQNTREYFFLLFSFPVVDFVCKLAG